MKISLSGTGFDGALWALIFLGMLVFAGVGLARAEPATRVPREVLAFYYGWWGTPQTSGSWVHWDGVRQDSQFIANTARYPQGGPYDSHDPATVERQLRQMHAAGLTGLVSSWWGRGTFDDRSLDLVVAAAPRHALKVSAYYEQVPELPAGAGPQARVDAVLADLNYLLDRHGSDPAWLKVGGRPVLFVFRRAVRQLGVDGWWAVSRGLAARRPRPLLIGDFDLDGPVETIPVTFGGVHAYANNDLTAGKTPEVLRDWADAAFPRWTAKWRSTIRCLTIMPGFGNAHAAGSPIAEPKAMTERFGGETYAALGEAALRANPDWLLVTSWNEWHEGTEIEPSVEYGDRALRETRDIARRFRQLPARQLRLR